MSVIAIGIKRNASKESEFKGMVYTDRHTASQRSDRQRLLSCNEFLICIYLNQVSSSDAVRSVCTQPQRKNSIKATCFSSSEININSK